MKTKRFTLTFAVLLTIQLTTLRAQTLFLENFETSPVTSILNTFNSETQLTNGPSTCGLATRGNTADFNSTNVNFNNTQNPGYFLGMNPQSPCGGAYGVSLITSTLSFSGQDSLRFKCRYFQSTTLNWGMPGSDYIMVIISNGTLADTIQSEFITTDNWDSINVALPSYLISPTVTIRVIMGQGEGFGMDDIQIINIQTTGVEKYNVSDNIKLYPNPFNNNFIIVQPFSKLSELTIYNVMGEIIYTANISSQQVINSENWKDGIYFYQLKQGQEIIKEGKMIKR